MPYVQQVSLWYLTIFVLLSARKNFRLALQFTRSTDHAIFHAAGMGSEFLGCLTASLVLDVAASYYVVRPQPIGFGVILASLTYAAIYNIVAFGLASENLTATKAAYLRSRELRGFPANPETASKVFSPGGMKAALGIALFFTIASIGALAANRWRFLPTTGTIVRHGAA